MKFSKKTKKNGLVSVIMNCYNGDKYLNQALNSLMTQTYRNWELIFFDNNSSDKSAEVVKSYNDKRIKYFKNKNNIKLGLARKKAINMANGEFIAFLDTDDLWLNEKLYLQLSAFENKKVGFSITDSIFFNESKIKLFKPFKLISTENLFYKLIENYSISFDTVIIRKSFLTKLDHSIDDQFNIIHDMDLLIRLSKICKMSYLPLALSKWRMAENSTSFNNFDTIIKEKDILINKLSVICKDDLKFKYSKERYMDILYRQKILFLLSKKKIIKVFSLINMLKLNFKNLFLILLIIFPFKKYIFKNILNLKY